LYIYEYDNLDNLLSVTFPDSKTIAYEYTSPHHPSLKMSTTDRAGKTWLTKYNPDHSYKEIINPQQEMQRFKHDANGNLEQCIDPNLQSR